MLPNSLEFHMALGGAVHTTSSSVELNPVTLTTRAFPSGAKLKVRMFI